MVRFSIRDVLLATTVVGMALGWSLEARRASQWERRANWAADFLRREGWDFDWDDPHNFRSNPEAISYFQQQQLHDATSD